MKYQKGKEKITRVDYSDTLVHQHITEFHADIIGGNLIVIEGSSQKEASIRIQWKEGSQDTYPLFYIKGTILCLKSKSWRAFIGQHEPFVIEVTLPPSISVHIAMVAGVIHLESLTGDVTVFLKAGEIIGDLSGKIINAKLWAGDIRLLFNRVTSDSDITVQCSLGDVQLQFPQGVLSCPLQKSKDGSIVTSLGARIVAKTILGDVQVQE